MHGNFVGTPHENKDMCGLQPWRKSHFFTFFLFNYSICIHSVTMGWGHLKCIGSTYAMVSIHITFDFSFYSHVLVSLFICVSIQWCLLVMVAALSGGMDFLRARPCVLNIFSHPCLCDDMRESPSA